MNTQKPILGITMGDPSGVGPEVVVKALENPKTFDICRPLVIGDAEMIKVASDIMKGKLKIKAVNSVDEADFKADSICVLDQKTVDPDKFKFGQVSTMGGHAAFKAVKAAIELALAGSIDATVTAPINKEALKAANYDYAGHTEIYADLTGTKKYTMMLAEGDIRVTHVSTHVSLRQACDWTKKDRILEVIRLSDEVCKRFGIKAPRVAVAGLNPHSGENGMFGTEEIEEIIPAIEAARAEQITVEGPVPPDTLFPRMKSGAFDIAVAMYHDQGHIPMKVIGFNFAKGKASQESIKGVNITLGLPIVRSSVDHGTAFDKAGKGIANADSMFQAIEYGALLSKNR